MKKIINKDIFGITNRVKKINKNYYFVYNFKSKSFEVHFKGQCGNTYCLKNPYKTLDYRILHLINKTSNRHIKKIISNIDKQEQQKLFSEQSHSKEKMNCIIKDIYDYESNNSKSYDINNFINLVQK